MASILKVQDIQNSSGANIINESSNTITIGASGDNIIIPSGATITNNGTSVGLGGVNTPAFSAQVTNNSTISISNATVTKITFATEIFDSDSKYDTSTSRFTPTVAGKYFVYARLSFDSASDFDDIRLQIHKNGTRNNSMVNRNEYYTQIYIYDVLDLNTTDYIEIYAYQDSGGSLNILTNEDGRRACFGAFKIIGA